MSDQSAHGTGSLSTLLIESTQKSRMVSSMKFGPFSVTNQVFHLSPACLSYALVNLKPLLPGHVLVCPVRCSPRLSKLTPPEIADLFSTVQRVSRTIERVYGASALNVAIQDGVDAGQSVPHVHVHIIPRKLDDLKAQGGGDKIYDMMEGDEGNVGRAFQEMQKLRDQRANDRKFASGPDADRKSRCDQEMKDEAAWLKKEMEKDCSSEVQDAGIS